LRLHCVNSEDLPKQARFGLICLQTCVPDPLSRLRAAFLVTPVLAPLVSCHGNAAGGFHLYRSLTSGLRTKPPLWSFRGATLAFCALGDPSFLCFFAFSSSLAQLSRSCRTTAISGYRDLTIDVVDVCPRYAIWSFTILPFGASTSSCLPRPACPFPRRT